jgi:hypothetical protein
MKHTKPFGETEFCLYWKPKLEDFLKSKKKFVRSSDIYLEWIVLHPTFHEGRERTGVRLLGMVMGEMMEPYTKKGAKGGRLFINGMVA